MFLELKKFFKSRRGSWTVLAALMLVTVFFLSGVSDRGYAGAVKKDGKLHVLFFDVGQGDSALLVMPDGADVLIDGGPDGGIAELLGRSLPPSDRTIEMVVLTHPHADHLSGLLEVVKRYKVLKILTTRAENEGYIYGEWLRQIKEKNISVAYAEAGEEFAYGGAVLKVLSPDERMERSVKPAARGDGDINDTSVVLKLVFGSKSFLFMGDAGMEIEKYLLKTEDIDVDVLKAGHHGSKYSGSYDFIKRASPEHAVISSGAGNSYGHPSFRALRTLGLAGARVWRTDTVGTVFAESDGRTLGISAERRQRASCQGKIFVLRFILQCE